MGRGTRECGRWFRGCGVYIQIWTIPSLASGVRRLVRLLHPSLVGRVHKRTNPHFNRTRNSVDVEARHVIHLNPTSLHGVTGRSYRGDLLGDLRPVLSPLSYLSLMAYKCFPAHRRAARSAKSGICRSTCRPAALTQNVHIKTGKKQ